MVCKYTIDFTLQRSFSRFLSLFFRFQAQRLWSGAPPEPSGERQVVLGARNHFGCPKTQLAMFV